MKRRRLVILWAIAIAHAFPQETKEPALSLITTGSFHKGEVRARTGQQWLGLVPTRGGFAWRVVSPIVRPVEDPISDGIGQNTGVGVSVRGGTPVFLIRRAGDLSRAKVKPAFYRRDGSPLPETDSLKLSCSDYRGRYGLNISNRRVGEDAPARVSRLVLEGDGLKQTLYQWPEGFSDQHCELIWAGDLDGDGKLDLLMNLSDHYNVSEVTLFLSSRRAPGTLVKRVASFRTTGC